MLLPEVLRYRRGVCMPILALFFISLGGLLLHLRVHPPSEDAFDLVPILFGVASTFVLPFLFNHPKTVAWAYVINLAAVAVGTLGMAYYSITHWPDEMPVTLGNLVLRTTLADILILAAKVPLGQSILRHFRPLKEAQGA